MDGHRSGMREGADPWFGPEHRMLRDQVRRFVEEEIKPRADAWEEQGLCRATCCAGWGSWVSSASAIRRPIGGSEMDALGTIVLAEELGRSGYGGVAIRCSSTPTWPRCTCSTAARKEQRARWMPGIIAGEVITPSR